MRSTLPALHEFLVVDLDPGFDEAALPAGQVALSGAREAAGAFSLSCVSMKGRAFGWHSGERSNSPTSYDNDGVITQPGLIVLIHLPNKKRTLSML